MAAYKCWFPGCKYETNSRSKIDFHHVTPREVDPKSKVTVPLCKTCHALIYHPESKAGQHSINSPQSIQIMTIYESTAGKALHCKDYDGNELYYYPNDGTIYKD
jgi:hypothetical protein